MSRDSAEQLRRLYDYGTVSGLGEPALLDRFVGRGDPTAFEAIVARHGPMVLAVCRRILQNPHDVDDAFQATFLVLAKKAGSLRNREALGPWLYGVAFKVASRARSRSKAPAVAAGVGAAVEPPGASIEREESAVALHEELARLPESYRAPILLCYFEGLTHDQAAERLRWPVGTVRGRLSRARDALRARLDRRGFGPSAIALLDSPFRPFGLPILAIREATVAALAFSAKGTGLAAISPTALSLAKGALNMMAWNQWKAPILIAAALVAAATGTVLSAGQAEGDGEKSGKPEQSGKPKMSKAEEDKQREAKDKYWLALEKVMKELDATLPKINDDDVPKKNEAARDEYDALLEKLTQQVAGIGTEVEVLEVETESLRNSLGAAIDQEFAAMSRLELQRPKADEAALELASQAVHHARDQRARAAAALTHSLHKLGHARDRLGEADRDLNELKGRPRPAVRVEIQPGDEIVVEVLEALPGRPISGPRHVRADGVISLSFYGEIYVVGLTPLEAKAKVIVRLRRFLPDEALGLVQVDITTGEPKAVAPKDTNHVFVEIVPKDGSPVPRSFPARFYGRP